MVSVWFLWASAAALALRLSGSRHGWSRASSARSSAASATTRRGCVSSATRSRAYKLVDLHPDRRDRGDRGALYYPQAGIINPAEIAPIASIYLAVWVAIGGRGRLYGAVIGAASCQPGLDLVHRRAGPGRSTLGFYTDPLGRLVDRATGPLLRCRHAVRAQGHRRAVRSDLGTPISPTATAPTLAPTPAIPPREGGAWNEPSLLEVSGVSVILRRVSRRSTTCPSPSARRNCGPSSARTARARPPSWTSSPARPNPDDGAACMWGEKSVSLLRHESESQHRPRRRRAEIPAARRCSRISRSSTTSLMALSNDARRRSPMCCFYRRSASDDTDRVHTPWPSRSALSDAP